MMRPTAFAIAFMGIGGCGMPDKRPNEVSALQMTVTDVFDIKGRGAVLFGRVNVGRIAVGDSVMVISGRDTIRASVRSIEKFQQFGVKEVTAGPDDVGVEVDGVSVDGIRAALTVSPLTVVSAR